MENKRLEEIKEQMGHELYKTALDIWAENIESWFTTKNKYYGNKSPEDLCREKKQEKLEEYLGRSEHGIHL